jgi:peroxiredoxin Q/BCP
MPNLQVGDTAPDFELPVRTGETVRLSTALEKGPVILLTYVLDFTPG